MAKNQKENLDQNLKNMEQQQQTRKQRPFVVIGTYDSCHNRMEKPGNKAEKQQQIDEKDEDRDKLFTTTANNLDFEQSTDLFSYCRRSSQFNYHNFPSRTNNHQDTIATTTSSSSSSSSLYNQKDPLIKLRSKLSLNQIKGPSGSVRGHKDVVRKSLENIRAVASISSKRNFNSTNFQSFQPSNQQQQQQQQQEEGYNSLACSSLMMQMMDEQHREEYLERLIEDELGQCVAYTTTLGVIRRTFEDCKLMRSILDSNLIKYEERDIYLNQEWKKQLRLRCNIIQVPVLFVDGKVFGGIKELEIINEDGNLAIQLAQFKMSEAPKYVCYCCGNAKFIACQSCNGSRKSAIHHFKYNSIALRCIKCDKNDGLVDCPVCCSKGESFNEMTSTINSNHEPTASDSLIIQNENEIKKTTDDDINNNEDSNIVFI